MLTRELHKWLLIPAILIIPILAVADTNTGNKAGLEAGKVDAIRTISRNVLTAKRNDTPNPEEQMLRRAVEELQQTVDKLHLSLTSVDISVSGPSKIILVDDKTKNPANITAVSPDNAGSSVTGQSKQASTIDNKSPKPTDKTTGKDHDKRERLKNDARGALDKSRAQRSRFETAAESRPEHKRGHEHKVATKLKELEDELDSVLQAPPETQAAKLAALKERLKIHRAKVDRKLDDTPTISTIVRHRN